MRVVQLQNGYTKVDLGLPDEFGVSSFLELSRVGDNYLRVRDEDTNYIGIEIPEWLADGIRELVKNKIEQENNRGA